MEPQPEEHNMPLVNRLSNDYDPTQGIAGGIRSIGEVMAQGPRLRAQAALNRAQIGKTVAEGNESVAHGEVYKQLGLKTQQEIQGANEIAQALSQPGAVQQDSMGNVVISGPVFQRVVGSLSKAGHGANDTALGIGNMFKSQNSTVQSGADRQNKIDVARVKPVILNPGQTEVSNASSISGVDAESGDPTATPGIGGVIAQSPPKPISAQQIPADTETIRQDINPAYRDNTNAPPTISLTNTTRHIRSPGVVAPQAKIPQAHAAYLMSHPDTAAQFDQKYGAGSAASILKK